MKLGIDILGNIALLKFDRTKKVAEKKRVANKFMKEHKNVRTVLEKIGGFSGRLRTQKTKWLVGEKTKEALYKENGCEFRFNVDTCYFSPRLSEERKELAEKIKKKEEVLVMFAGVGPFAIVIAKSGCKKVVSVELGRDCSKYAKINVKRNKLDNVLVVQGDVRKLQLLEKVLGVKRGKNVEKITKLSHGGFDRIVMARPNLKDSFLDVAFKASKKNTVVHYYGFSENKKFSDIQTLSSKNRVRSYHEDDKNKMIEMIKDEAKKARKKIKILKVKRAGDVGAYRFRFRVDLKVVN